MCDVIGTAHTPLPTEYLSTSSLFSRQNNVITSPYDLSLGALKIQEILNIQKDHLEFLL